MDIHFLPLYDIWNFSASDMSCLDQAASLHHPLVWVSWELLHKKGFQVSEMIKKKKLLITFVFWLVSMNMQNIYKFYLNFQPDTLHSQVSFQT